MAYAPQVPPSVTDIARARLGDLTVPYLLENWVYDSILQGTLTNEGLAQLAEAIGTSLSQSSGVSLSLGDQKYAESSGDRSQKYFDFAKALRSQLDATTMTGGVGSLATPVPNRLDGYDPNCDPNAWPCGPCGPLYFLGSAPCL